MDPRSLHHIVDDIIGYCLLPGPKEESKPPLRVRGIRGPYSPGRRLIGQKRTTSRSPSTESCREKHEFWNDDCDTDAGSTWEFSSPVRCLSPVSNDTGSTESTPAQELVIRYRTGQPLDIDTPSTMTRSSSPSVYSQPDSWESDDVSEYTPIQPESIELKDIRRQSRAASLIQPYEEAMGIMQRSALGEHDQLVCQRAGCRDTVPNVRALMYHIHIHNIDNTVNATTRSERHLELDNDMAVQRCLPIGSDGAIRRRLMSLPTLAYASPIIVRDSFRRIMGRVVSY